MVAFIHSEPPLPRTIMIKLCSGVSSIDQTESPSRASCNWSQPLSATQPAPPLLPISVNINSFHPRFLIRKTATYGQLDSPAHHAVPASCYSAHPDLRPALSGNRLSGAYSLLV